MSSIIGKVISASVFGESHGKAIGAVIDGLPAGVPVDENYICSQMDRRAPGKDLTSTPRKEADAVQILSGVMDGYTTGMPLCGIIENNDTRSSDYSYLKDTPRPSHADFPAMAKYGEHFDIRGSGHFSGRLTAPIVFAGAVCRAALEQKGVTVGGHVLQIGEVKDTSFDMANVDADLLKKLSRSSFGVIDGGAEEKMRAVVEAARLDCDSVGGTVEVAVTGLPVGVGEPMARGIESVISSALFAVPAVKGVEFGAGFAFAQMRGTEANDRYINKNGKIATESNNNGGILGGISTGMPLIVRVAVKPTPSVGAPQNTLNVTTMQEEELTIRGRHDPCIVPRALPVIESALCIALCDLMKEGGWL